MRFFTSGADMKELEGLVAELTESIADSITVRLFKSMSSSIEIDSLVDERHLGTASYIFCTRFILRASSRASKDMWLRSRKI